MAQNLIIYLGVLSLLLSAVLPEPTTAPAPAPVPADEPAPRAEDPAPEEEDAPEGYYAFVESPNATPPRVRPPPYRKVDVECPEAGDAKPHVTAHNLCGDLNRGDIPRNPMGQSPDGEPYPFELIRNHTLRFLSRALPALRNDDSLPRVAHLPHASDAPAPQQPFDVQNNR
ncbi:SH3 domain-binding protein 1-like [Ostrinia nubilalis]|uniref:SH3 domain-binding protein 1-like n=1 Tax=Ostrinia nubilalis TaxID=29057 RepID=UPI0030824323